MNLIKQNCCVFFNRSKIRRVKRPWKREVVNVEKMIFSETYRSDDIGPTEKLMTLPESWDLTLHARIVFYQNSLSTKFIYFCSMPLSVSSLSTNKYYNICNLKRQQSSIEVVDSTLSRNWRETTIHPLYLIETRYLWLVSFDQQPKQSVAEVTKWCILFTNAALWASKRGSVADSRR